MRERTGLTQVEYFVLHESDGDAPLPEIFDAWLDNGARSPTVEEAVPALAGALMSLTADGLVEVRRFTTWPAPWSGGARVEGAHLRAEVGGIDPWLPGPARTGLLVARVTGEGGAYL
ncbi:hypothetical protein M2302_000839 [Micromonospora sp. A200]|uniref:hypothetical protein n=1 Tax=Micromonospora sp. A200 TaxID=2940568 RepID=UPI0024763CB4|nr:hypothetical protein [Micromonospora sp. A200]MDH6460678.1 hypothetical protein [Micromonospora sp. A200]